MTDSNQQSSRFLAETFLKTPMTLHSRENVQQVARDYLRLEEQLETYREALEKIMARNPGGAHIDTWGTVSLALSALGSNPATSPAAGSQERDLGSGPISPPASDPASEPKT